MPAVSFRRPNLAGKQAKRFGMFGVIDPGSVLPAIWLSPPVAVNRRSMGV